MCVCRWGVCVGVCRSLYTVARATPCRPDRPTVSTVPSDSTVSTAQFDPFDSLIDRGDCLAALRVVVFPVVLLDLHVFLVRPHACPAKRSQEAPDFATR